MKRLAGVTRWMMIAAIAGVCQNPAALTTGLTGTIYRGPIMPVCRTDVPCDAPMAATFEVRQGDRVVAGFTTDDHGKFTVKLPPGRYTVVPSGGGLMSSFPQPVEVGPEGMTSVELRFDTGIR